MDWEKAKDDIIKAGIAAFGESVEYHAQLRLPVEIRGIFDAAFVPVDPQSGVSVGSSVPMIDIRLADLPTSPSPGDRVLVRGDFYRVVTFQPDGQGAAKLLLHKI